MIAASLTSLRKDIALLGWCRKATGRILLELALGLILALGGIVIFVLSSHLLIRACAMLISTIGSLVVATNTHTSSHCATSDKRWINELLTFLGYPVFLGLSATFWWHKHVVVHHPAPNVIGVDSDLDLSPWFAITRDEVGNGRGLRRWYYETLQWSLFPVSLAANGFHMQKSGWVYLLHMLTVRRRRRDWIDLVALLLHYAAWIAVPLFFFRPADVFAFYGLRIGLMGYAMYAVLAPGHFPADAVVVTESQKNADYALLQTATTLNFRTGPLGRLVCSGLEYQIEHHLFPHVSHVYYPKMSAIVQQFCRANGLPYRTYGWGEVLWKSWAVLRTPKEVERNLASQRVRV